MSDMEELKELDALHDHTQSPIHFQLSYEFYIFILQIGKVMKSSHRIKIQQVRTHHFYDSMERQPVGHPVSRVLDIHFRSIKGYDFVVIMYCFGIMREGLIFAVFLVIFLTLLVMVDFGKKIRSR